MPAHVHSGPIGDKIPPGWTSLEIQNLRSTNVSRKYAQLQVKDRHKHYACRVNRLKMLLEDERTSSSSQSDNGLMYQFFNPILKGHGNIIDFFALGQVADDLDICEKGNTLLCVEFEVEQCPGHWQLPYQIIADDTRPEQSLIWILKPLGNAALVSSPQKAVDQEIEMEKKQSDKKKNNRQYNYRVLSDIQVNSVVDVYGVVKFVKPTVRGRGSDYYCVIGLVDPSLVENRQEEKLTCVFFHREPEKLPNVEEGDVLRLHRLKIQTYQGGKQGYNGPGFQWLAFHKSLDSRTFSSPLYTFEALDEETVAELLGWWSELCESETFSPLGTKSTKSHQRTTLAEVMPKSYFDIVCQVVQVCVLDPGICRLLRVWDGTKFEGDVKKVTDGELNKSLREDSSLVEASRGLTVDIFMFDNHASESECVKPGDSLLLTNLHSPVVSNLVEMTIHGGGQSFGRGFQVLPASDRNAQILRARLDPILKTVASTGSGTPKAQKGKSSICNHQGEDEQNEASKHAVGIDNDADPDKNDTGSDGGINISVRENDGRISPVMSNSSDDGKFVSRRGRKDVPSKNKSLRSRLKTQAVLSTENTKTSVDSDLNQSCDNVNNPKNCAVDFHQADGSVVSFKTATEGEEEDKDSSAEDSSQSIWLSLYNESTCKNKVSQNPDDQRPSSDTPQQLTVNSETQQPQQLSQNSEGSQQLESLQLGLQSQELLQGQTGDTQVSSSTDSHKSLPEPRCMLKTASVVVNHQDVERSTLREVLDHVPPHKFRIQAKVERIEPRPSGPGDLVHFLCPQCKYFSRMSSSDDLTRVFAANSVPCPKCTQHPVIMRPVTVLILELFDTEDTISASVWDKNADQFLGGISAHQLLSDHNSFLHVQELLTNLCPLGSSLEDRPELECCVFSYYVDGDVKIQIFDTTLV